MREGNWPPKMFDLMPAGTESPEEREKKELQAEFDETLKGKFDRLPNGLNFKTELPGIENLTVTTPPRGEKKMAYANVVYRPPDAKASRIFSYSISGDGRIIPSLSPGQKLPAELAGLRKEDILREVLADIKRLDLDFWVETDMDVAPPGEWPAENEAGAKTAGPKEEQLPMDPERLEFFRQQPGVLFGHVTKKGGFKDYRVFFFRDFAVIEHPARENAAYFIDLAEPLDATIGYEMKREEKIAAVKQHWPEELRLTKQAMRQRGDTYVVHQGDWERKIQGEIDRRMRPKE